MYWYEDEVQRIEKEHLKLTYQPETIFYGSSSIRLWESLYDDFPELKPVNLGFGGSTLAACVWYFERVMTPFHPKMIIIYAGDNDLGDGRHPEEIFIFFQQLMIKMTHRFGNIPCYFISLKPSLQRWQMVEQFRYANSLIKNEIHKHHHNWKFIDIFKEMLSPEGQPKQEYFVEDGLHLSENGYELWKEVIGSAISQKP